ncbi:MAG: response regulator transcription factor [Ardenticatenaceae bacterium]|nr:response regulator transcription factor [Ardenticatenaceae bacterium]
MSTPTKISVLIVDDHTTLRQGLTLLLGQQNDIKPLAGAHDGQEAIQLAAEHQPDVILLDLVLPDISATKLLTALRQKAPYSKILVFSGIEDGDQVYEAIDAGIDGYALKSMDVSHLAEAIRQVAAGYSFLHPAITRMVLHRAAQKNRPVPNRAPESLTKRQHQVLMLMASTATNAEIAERLLVSQETVRSHVKTILRKLDVPTRTQAVLEAVRRGIISV